MVVQMKMNFKQKNNFAATRMPLMVMTMIFTVVVLMNIYMFF